MTPETDPFTAESRTSLGWRLATIAAFLFAAALLISFGWSLYRIAALVGD